MKKIIETIRNAAHSQSDEIRIPAQNKLCLFGFGFVLIGVSMFLYYIAKTYFGFNVDPGSWGIASVVIGSILFVIGSALDGVI